MDPMALLEQKIEEAELDLTDVQVHAVIKALCKVLQRHANMMVEIVVCRAPVFSAISTQDWDEGRWTKGASTEKSASTAHS
jgi:hypothetical protein